jgi:hypothetical protein
MSDLYRYALTVHVACGIAGLAAFWTPALARKGGALHVRAGRVFFWATSAVAASGFAMASLLLLDPLGIHPPARGLSPEAAAAVAGRVRLSTVFLYYLLCITFVPVYHGVRVLATRHDPATLRTPVHTLLNAATIAISIATAAVGLVAGVPVFVFMSPIGLLIGLGNLQFARRPYPTPMAWWYEHMNAMLGGGIAFHTAFLVLGAGRLLGVQIDGPAAIVPWLLPTAIGVPASAIWTRYYKRRFSRGLWHSIPRCEPSTSTTTTTHPSTSTR